ncbi:MAG: Permease of the drug/metabolite transporter superfamily [Myxococcaceae bacterium]|nr:Permease of the drug/metabolite transporter superfamily [Myxococcaceae bacterium]
MAPTAPLDRRTIFALFLVYVVWGSTYLVMRFAVEGLPPLLMGGTRFVIAGVILVTVLRLKGEAFPTVKQWLWSAPVGALFFLFGNGLVAIAEQKISSGVAAVVCATMPLWAAAMGPLFKERTSSREWIAMVLGMAGVIILSAGSELRADLPSTLVLMAAPIAWALGSLLARRLPLPRGLMSAAAQMVTGGVILLAVALVRGERFPADPSFKSLASVAYLIVFGSLVAFSAYSHLLRNTRPAIAMSYSYVNPAIAVLLGAALGAEQLQGNTLVATALIVAATVVMVRSRSGAAPAPAAVPTSIALPSGGKAAR